MISELNPKQKTPGSAFIVSRRGRWFQVQIWDVKENKYVKAAIISIGIHYCCVGQVNLTETQMTVLTLGDWTHSH